VEREEITMTEELDQKERELLNYANNTPMVLSLLYDIDMMPEQVLTKAGGWEKRRTREWFKMLMIISTIKIAAEGDSAPQQSGASSTTDAGQRLAP
jgi:hypothetical protein